MDIAEFNFEKIIDGADWFHTTGITPALSDRSAALTEAALKAAKAKGITTSIDLNYRKKLWNRNYFNFIRMRKYKVTAVYSF